ncbi:outer membrane lipoprotein LolB [Thalassotalea sp. M1531]|uniref:Outer-membrane lipoprotein LolB n=1 Tax=Thalassotalea algicola TaxID=2716224 RepID=A0A7Y0LFK1_9GAMM|nr:lipoprotein insertase outer membrane protein LolB [Thalassotalea algicola]NMP33307.1 outer membrane lipoprotein LolB [Thalassotalea algicola]
MYKYLSPTFLYKHSFKTQLSTLILLLLQGCTQLPDSQAPQKVNVTNRAKIVNGMESWQIKGQIAFLQQNKRQKASLNWHKKYNNQTLNLTTYLGINVLNLETTDGIHTLEVDGKTYHSDDLDRLIWQLTGLLFPSQALPYWIKGVPFSPQDQIKLDQNTALPKQLTSYYNNRQWQIQYKNYKQFKGIDLPTSLTVQQDGFTIKLAIRHWQFN